MNWFSTSVKRWLELRRLDRAAHHRSRPRACAMVSHDDHRAVWRVLVPGRPQCFICASSGHLNREMFVVQVDTKMLYRTWLAGTSTSGVRRSGPCVLRDEMAAEPGFDEAQRDFARGLQSPVPLIEVRIWRERRKVRIAFVASMASAFWLIANRAPAFPVEVVGHDAADLLYRLAGCGPAPLPFETLFTSKGRVDDRQRQFD